LHAILSEVAAYLEVDRQEVIAALFRH